MLLTTRLGVANQRACFRVQAVIWRRYSTSKSCDPLRILFCGSDEFSIASLEALHAEHTRKPSSIESIEVVCRPPKRVGRGLKQIREVPIKAAATKLGLRIHEIDTFTGWTPPGPLNLIIAVSFGLFVPPRILKSVKYGGLNAHPSLLPNFRGPAPLHHTLLAGKTQTGVTLQTLHHERFDHGVILDQTPLPGFDIPNSGNCTVPELLEVVSPKAAEILVNGIRNHLFVPPIQAIQQSALEDESELIHATKITPEDRHIKWNEWDREHISRRDRVLGPLWNNAIVANESDGLDNSFQTRRVIFTNIEEVDSKERFERFRLLPGVPFAEAVPGQKPHIENALYVYSGDGKLLRLREIKVEAQKVNDGFRAAKKAQMFSNRKLRLGDVEFYVFHNPLF